MVHFEKTDFYLFHSYHSTLVHTINKILAVDVFYGPSPHFFLALHCVYQSHLSDSQDVAILFSFKSFLWYFFDFFHYFYICKKSEKTYEQWFIVLQHYKEHFSHYFSENAENG